LHFVLTNSRGVRNLAIRLPTLFRRFGLRTTKSEIHLQTLLEVCQRHSAPLTLPVTAVTAKRHPHVVRWLALSGVELAAHGYVHNDYSALPPEEQDRQIGLARDAFSILGLDPKGWRCPYSRWNDATLDALRIHGFSYDATPVYVWPAYEEEYIQLPKSAADDFARVCRLYNARDTRRHTVLPTVTGNLIQIPMSIPQDEDMVDRIHLNTAAMTRVWVRMLRTAHGRGELFVICLHPERAELCAEPLDATLAEARRLGSVWVASLGDVADWWRQRHKSRLDLQGAPGHWRLTVCGPSRLVTYFARQQLIGEGSLSIDTELKPVVRCSPAWSPAVVQRIRDAGYLVESTNPSSPALNLDERLPRDTTPDDAVRFIQENDGDLVRIAPWPAGNESCLSISGDLDAITLFDFAMRISEF
jgi:peptidoglycan/xylan/chitin deacetylase (PgdA/CDA1 family)